MGTLQYLVVVLIYSLAFSEMVGLIMSGLKRLKGSSLVERMSLMERGRMRLSVVPFSLRLFSSA